VQSIIDIPARLRGARWTDRDVLLLLAALTVAMRIPYLFAPLGIDEGGYAYVASRWNEGTGQLYGDQWVDRPPLLLALYAVAMSMGGEPMLRVVGTIAALVTVLACAGVAGRVAGSTALRWSGVVATVLTSSALLQGQTVNAELPAIACTAGAAWLATIAASDRTGRARWAAVAAGFAAGCAMLMKQSFIDGYAFGFGLVIALLVLGGASVRRRGWVVLAGGIAGLVLVAGLVAAWAATFGPGVGALIDALYVFRLEARGELQAMPGATNLRAYMLSAIVVMTGLLFLFVAVLAGLVRIATSRQAIRADVDVVLIRAVAAGLVVMGAAGMVGILLGGSWWTHYLLQLVPMLSIGTGLVVVAGPGRARSALARHATGWSVLVAVTAVSTSLVSVGLAANGDYHRRPAMVGAWLADAADPDDTAFVTWGHANVLQRSGLRSPYPLVWSMPTRVRDPELREFRSVVAGDDAPTWIVRWSALNSWQLDPDGELKALLAARYEHVATICGVRILRLQSAGSGDQLPAEPDAADCATPDFSSARIGEAIRDRVTRRPAASA
jgi:hypothetical protein